MTSAISFTRMQWIRSPNGILAGVCEGMGRQLDMNPWVLRAAWLATVLFFGTGLLLYLIMAYALPRTDKLPVANVKRYLGVCARIARKSGIDVGLLRALTVILVLFSFGAALVGYVILYFVLPEDDEIMELKVIDRTSSNSC